MTHEHIMSVIEAMPKLRGFNVRNNNSLKAA